MFIQLASVEQTAAVCALDAEVLGHAGRFAMLQEAIQAGLCLVAVTESGASAGFAVWRPQGFFGCDFLELVIVAPSARRQGVAFQLLNRFDELAAGPKLFTSTNESNLPMQRLCERAGYVPSGRIDNLDEGDPELVYFKRIGGP